MSKAMLVMDMPECCGKEDPDFGGIKICCPLAWHTFCSQFAPKGLDMTNGEWEQILSSGKKPDWCPLREVPEKKLKDGSDLWRS